MEEYLDLVFDDRPEPDYRRWGVLHIWVVDPQVKRLYEYSEAGLLQFPALRLPELDFEVSARQLFKDI